MNEKGQRKNKKLKNIQFWYVNFWIAPCVLNYRSAKESIIHLLVRINTFMHSFRAGFLLFKKNTVFTTGTEGKAIERDHYHISNTFFQRTEGASYLSQV